MSVAVGVLAVAGSLIVLVGFMFATAKLAVGQAIRPVQEATEKALRPLQNEVRGMGLQVAGLTGLANHMARVLAVGGLVSAGRAVEIAQSYNAQWRRLDEEERASLNALTAEELQRFDGYRVKLAERGEMLTAAEVEDYQVLCATLDRDRPRDPALPILLGLGLILAAVIAAGVGGRTGKDEALSEDGR